MIFYWNKNRKQIKSANFFAFELWTVRQFQGLASFSKWTVSALLASLCHLYSCFCLFIMVTFLAPLGYVQLLQLLLAEACEGRLSWVLECFTSILLGGEARAVLRAIWPVFTGSSGNFLFHNRDCFELCTMCVFKLLVSFLTSELCTLQKVAFSLAFAFARTVSVWAFSWRFCLMDGNVPKGFERCWKKFLALRGLLAWALFFSSCTSRG